ncbi:sodium-independent sulfate anion transporter-like [Uloborus diversus]|uniref:sodium-independent sulfate anion transporter-like n=1 Tax=Uloborus diversus TaxID=327109 RepID=UPI0024095943|nr:sodium-independent sulfate anion transporter-like [Uloborus diversus]XP_054716552.1 sodium-independent sulfate anion transporter-like [Uloborus diversus]
MSYMPKSCCLKLSWNQRIKKCIPILSWLPEYSLQDFKGDFIAGFTVGLTVVPQGLALAQLANLPPQYGLFSAFMGSFMYAIFGTCKDLVVGPTSVMALMTAEYVQMGGPLYASLLAFICGCLQLFLGICNLGFLVNFISAPVLSGFTSAAAIITAIAQIKGLFGLKFKARGFLSTVYQLFHNISQTNLYDMGMGITSIFFLLLLRKFKDQKFACGNWISGSQKSLEAIWWSFATARNALVVIACSAFASACLSLGYDVFSLTQRVDAGLPEFHFPEWSIHHFDPQSNSTINKDTSDVLSDLGSAAIVIPLISLLEAIAIAKTFTRGMKLQATREMIALGMGNLMGSFVSSYPVTGSFSRSVINHTSGVRTPLGGIISGTFVLLALCVITPSFHYIPKSCLSAIIFSAVIFMIHLEDIPAMWRTNKLELIPFFTTFICSFTLGLEYGLLFGAAISLAILLYKQNRPDVPVSIKKGENGHMFIHVTPESSIYFPSTDDFNGTVAKALYSLPDISQCTVIIHGDHLKELDYSTAMGIKNMVKSLEKDNIKVLLKITKPSTIKAFSCLEDFVFICKQEEELQNIIQRTESCIEEQEIAESSSADMLLAKGVSQGKMEDQLANGITVELDNAVAKDHDRDL